MARVLNLKDTNYKIPEGAVYVGRAMSRYGLSASKWGNPFRIGGLCCGTQFIDRELSIELYRTWLSSQILLGKLNISELSGKDLVCWCHNWDGNGANPMYCHADILLELANK